MRKNFIGLNLLILAALLLAGYGLTFMPDRHTPPSEKAVQDFSFADLAGNRHALSDYHGKIVILNFWASWCAPCVKEFPALVNIAKKHDSDTILIGLSADLTDNAITAFLDKMKKQGVPVDNGNLVFAWDTQDIAGKNFQTTKFPETFIIDAQGNLRAKLVGADWKPADLESYLDNP